MRGKLNKPSLALFFIASALTGCEGYRTADGTIVDRQSGQPLNGVFCNVVSGSESATTDQSGEFHLKNRMGGCMRKCKDITIEFSKNGYQTKRVTNPDNNSTIYMDK